MEPICSNKAAKRKRGQRQARVTMEGIPAPDTEKRLGRAFDLILRAVARAEEGNGNKAPR